MYTAPTLPILSYDTGIAPTALHVSWIPDGGNPQSVTGIMLCTGGTPGGMGLAGGSLAPANIIIYGFPLFIAIDPINLLFTSNFGFDAFGNIVVIGASRSAPFLAGQFAFIQFYETSPIPKSSNGIRMLLAP